MYLCYVSSLASVYNLGQQFVKRLAKVSRTKNSMLLCRIFTANHSRFVPDWLFQIFSRNNIGCRDAKERVGKKMYVAKHFVMT